MPLINRLLQLICNNNANKYKNKRYTQNTTIIHGYLFVARGAWVMASDSDLAMAKGAGSHNTWGKNAGSSPAGHGMAKSYGHEPLTIDKRQIIHEFIKNSIGKLSWDAYFNICCFFLIILRMRLPKMEIEFPFKWH